MDKSLVAQIVAAFLPGQAVHVEALSHEDEMYRRAKLAEAKFTGGVAFLRSFPNDLLQGLGVAIWDVFQHRHVVMAMGPPVPTLSFAAFGRPEAPQALVLAPHDWAEQVEADPVMQLGAIVLVGSQAVDFYNGRLQTEGGEGLRRRARSYEAEYLKAVSPSVLNDYQKGILADFPEGFDPSLAYERKPVVLH